MVSSPAMDLEVQFLRTDYWILDTRNQKRRIAPFLISYLNFAL